jgi:hypothetical protein
MLLRSRFSRIVRKAIDPVLLARGFARRGQTYKRPLDRIWWVFDVERSRWNTADECRFSIGGGILVPEVNNVIDFHLPPLMLEKADTGDSIIHYRPPTELERSWVITSADDADLVDNQIVEQIKGYIETKMMPFYEQFHGLNDVINFILSLKDDIQELPRGRVHPNELFIPLYLAALYWLTGDRTQACAYLEDAFETLQVEWWQNHLLRIRERLGCE